MNNIKKGFSRRIREMREEVVSGEGNGVRTEGTERLGNETIRFLEESNIEDGK